MECGKAHHPDRSFMVKKAFTTVVDGKMYIISSIRRVRGLFSMREKSASDPAAGSKSEDAARVLGALRSLQARNGVGATRAEIASHLDGPVIDVTATLGILQGEGLVVCEGTTGYPAQACWKLKDKT